MEDLQLPEGFEPLPLPVEPAPIPALPSAFAETGFSFGNDE